MLVMKKQKNVPYQAGLIVFLFVMSVVMVTSSPFQMLSDFNPDFTSNLSFKIAHASVEDENDNEAGEIDQQDFEQESEQDFEQESEEDTSEKSFEEGQFSFAQSEDAEEVDQEIGQQAEQQAEDAEEVDQDIGQQAEQQAEDAEEVD